MEKLSNKDILADHVYRGVHHGKDGVSDLRVVSVKAGKDAQGKHHKKCVTVEPTDPPHRQVSHSMKDFLVWAVSDVTKSYDKIPKSNKSNKTKNNKSSKGNKK